MEKKLQTLKNILDSSRYTVALCGSGILKECGYPGILSLDVAYEYREQIRRLTGIYLFQRLFQHQTGKVF